jgi:3-phenylpropionate/trans-cinnamate dioxygenase ferredoxin subunit
VAKVGESLHALDDTCTHGPCSLAEGNLDEAHGDVPLPREPVRRQTGEVLNPPATEPLPIFPLRVETDEIDVEV